MLTKERISAWLEDASVLDVEGRAMLASLALLGLERDTHAEHSDRVLAKLRAMTPEELRRTFIDAGIFDESGNLTEPYRG